MHEFRPAVWAGSVGKKSVQATEPVQVEPDTETVESDTEPLSEPPVEVDATDAAKAFAAQHSINLADVRGTGVDGRVTKDDVADHAYAHGLTTE